ncbi:hypothetical protein MNBD_GAMMA16-240 [hydrothermal vent metagenome]|uniref:TonB C-terminal domain-containing protein n=1 Tax=hydrothermal vent metagenome TaxID=652676 RepID=A0A3B0Z3A1_9ZZZZ
MQQKPEEPNNWALLPMKSMTRSLPSTGIAVTGGILLTLGLLFFINVLANYRTQVTEPRPLLVVDLATWPIPVKQTETPPTPKPEKQLTPEKLVSEKVPQPEISPQATKRVKKIPPEPVMHEPIEKKVAEKIAEAAEELPAEPTPPMLIEPTENALPTPVPIFRLTQAPRFLHRKTLVYPETMRTQGISGIVKLEALIDKEGRVRKVNILRSAGKYFDEAAKRAILASSFYPAEVDNEPVAVLLRLPVRFDLL